MKNLFTVVVVVALVVPAFIAVAQGPAPPPAPNEVPLDGFSALLLAAGAGYGARKALQKKKSKDN